VAFGLASGLAFGLLIVLLRRFRDRDPFWVLFCNNLVVAVLLFPWVRQEVWISGQDLALMLLMGSVQLGLAYVLFFMAMRHVSAREGSLIALLEPLLNPIWVALVVGEIPGAYTVIGGIVVLGGLSLRYVRAPSRGPRANERLDPGS
jgi:drug/metabolite transporter (DMT)-like permease